MWPTRAARGLTALRVMPAAPHALKDAAQAHRDLELRKTTGSSIFVV